MTYHDKEALSKIAHYRRGNTEWIVSVGMISEGTDIPRLQVCCHLSTVKTELYFRQVLVRILRVNQSKNQEAWLFTMATDELTLFSERLVENLPNDYKILQILSISLSIKTHGALSGLSNFKQINKLTHEGENALDLEFNQGKVSSDSIVENTKSLTINSLHQRVIDAFLFSNS